MKVPPRAWTSFPLRAGAAEALGILVPFGAAVALGGLVRLRAAVALGSLEQLCAAEALGMPPSWRPRQPRPRHRQQLPRRPRDPSRANGNRTDKGNSNVRLLHVR